ncbi:MAG: twin-arginine translocase subunit TatC [Candidatus Poseidoniales archaeon]
MSFLSDDDVDEQVYAHFDELALRVTIIFVSAMLCIGIWSMYIDDVLYRLIQFFTVCTSSCLNIYDPTQWSRIRWFSTILLGLISVSPILMYHSFQFAKSGLLPKERKMFKSWLFLTEVTVLIISVLSLVLVKILFVQGHHFHLGMGLKPKYDIVSMLSIWMDISLFLLLLTLTFSTFWLLHMFGILTRENNTLWSVRIFGFGSLLILASVSSFQLQNGITLAFAYILLTKAMLSITLNIGNTIGGIDDILDSEGKRIRNLIVDCSCDHAMEYSTIKPKSGMKLIQTESICTSSESRNEVMHQLIHNKCTHLTILGCDGNACPNRFDANLDRLNIHKIGLNLHSIVNRKGQQTIQQVDFENQLMTTESIYGHETVRKKYVELQDRFGEHFVVDSKLSNQPLEQNTKLIQANPRNEYM